MSTVRTCTTPEEGWGLYNHFISNLLLVIRFAKQTMDEVEDDDKRNQQETRIINTWAELVGKLYMIMRRMTAEGFSDESEKMQKVIDMLIELDISDPKTHEMVQEKHRQLNVKLRNFSTELAKLKSQHTQ